ncbi:NlpC/P60 family protein [Natrialbaceae archaeon A-CW1-1]
MTSVEELAVQRVKTVHAPDDRVVCFEVTVEAEDEGDDETPGIVLAGTVQTDRTKESLLEELRQLSTGRTVRDSLSVLEGTGEAMTTDLHVSAVRGEPHEDAEQVTQVLYGAELTAYDSRDGWRRVRTPGGYLGWVEATALTDPGVAADDVDVTDPGTAVDAVDKTDPRGTRNGVDVTNQSEWRPDGVVTAPTTPHQSNATPETVPAGVDCHLESRDDEEVTVSFRTGVRATLPETAIHERTSTGTGADVVAVARQFLRTPYEWGGMTIEGIDCSGLVWVAYASVGVTVPRDADQQRDLGTDVSQDNLEPGDLLFFPGHVAISLGGSEFVHAYGSAEQVTVNSLDPSHAEYVESLAESVTAMKRFLPAEGAR